MPPTLVLIRHAEALHNVNQEYNIADPELSERGRQQCVQLARHLETQFPAELDVGLILVSPMRRTVETALLSLGSFLQKGVPIQAHASWQENSDKPCDTGSPLDALAREFPQVDFSRVDPVYPDKTSPRAARYRYSRSAILARAQSALAELHDRPEKAVIVVSHSGFLRQGVTGHWYANADYRIYDFAPRASADAPIRLRQWEQTRRGGMGWSPEEAVEIGEDIPEEDVSPPPAP
ncbi:hypothetical protein VTK73DRAFT_3418 [Phialemonium thermophilum]|uniref:Phosphoglycerate mutase-like protein n=1 Tax=Phialemonium thermophilum TaxID=223376 RepID=A0ABR3VIQ5_9PEZI